MTDNCEICKGKFKDIIFKHEGKTYHKCCYETLTILLAELTIHNLESIKVDYNPEVSYEVKNYIIDNNIKIEKKSWS